MVRLYENLILQVFKNVVKLGIMLFVNCCIYHLNPIPGYSVLELDKAYKYSIAISPFLFLVGCFQFK